MITTPAAVAVLPSRSSLCSRWPGAHIDEAERTFVAVHPATPAGDSVTAYSPTKTVEPACYAPGAEALTQSEEPWEKMSAEASL
jgi:hypothetical protein